MLFGAIALLFLSFISYIVEKYAKRQKSAPGDADLSRRTKIWLLIFQILTFLIGVVLLFANESNTTREKSDLLHEKDSLRTKNISDSAKLNEKWKFDTSRLKQIVDDAEQNIRKTNQTLSKASTLLDTIKLINSKSKSILQLEEELKYPVSPMDLNITYKFQISLTEFYKKCPHYKDSIPRNMYLIHAKDLLDMDSESREFLSNASISLIFQIDSSSQKSVNKKKWMPFRMGENIINYVEISLTNGGLDITVNKSFDNVYPENLNKIGINDIRFFKGWFIRLAVAKQALSFSSVELKVNSGIPSRQRMYFNFIPGKPASLNVIQEIKSANYDALLEAP